MLRREIHGVMHHESIFLSLSLSSFSVSLFLNIYFYFLAVLGLSCGLQDLVPWLGLEPRPPALGAWRLSHWTTRKAFLSLSLNFSKSIYQMTSLLFGQFSKWPLFLLWFISFIYLEKEMATHSSVLAWRIPGTGEPGGLPSMGSHRVRHDWSDLAAAAAAALFTNYQSQKFYSSKFV